MRAWVRFSLMLFTGCLSGAPGFAATLDEALTVKEVQGQQATLEGKAAGLKAGDKVYIGRSPYQFSVAAVNGNQVTISLPSGSDLAAGQILTRQPNEAIKKALDTEDRLKKALED